MLYQKHISNIACLLFNDKTQKILRLLFLLLNTFDTTIIFIIFLSLSFHTLKYFELINFMNLHTRTLNT